jgi:hypothetical protein
MVILAPLGLVVGMTCLWLFEEARAKWRYRLPWRPSPALRIWLACVAAGSLIGLYGMWQSIH